MNARDAFARAGRAGPENARHQSTNPKIRIDHLRKIFGEDDSSTIAIDDLTLAIEDGEFVCILGPSGCGKTTALRVMAGLEKQSSGQVIVDTVAGSSRPINSMVFQEHSLFPWLTVIDNVAFGLEMRGIAKRLRYEQSQPFLKMVGLEKFKNHYPHQLSGGMKQRVSLARAFVNDPEILLMDEPFAALDAQNKQILQQELLKIWEITKKTVVFITHAIDEALLLGDRIVVMTAAPGRIKQIIPVDFPRPRKVAELRADPSFGELSLHIWNILESEVNAARGQQGAIS
jgi:NitT/TauT family transport system ATP-binding protein